MQIINATVPAHPFVSQRLQTVPAFAVVGNRPRNPAWRSSPVRIEGESQDRLNHPGHGPCPERNAATDGQATREDANWRALTDLFKRIAPHLECSRRDGQADLDSINCPSRPAPCSSLASTEVDENREA